jgi:hypothetical protein
MGNQHMLNILCRFEPNEGVIKVYMESYFQSDDILESVDEGAIQLLMQIHIDRRKIRQNPRRLVTLHSKSEMQN